MKMRILKLSCLLACSLSCLLSAAPRNNGGTVVVGAEKVTEAEDYETVIIRGRWCLNPW